MNAIAPREPRRGMGTTVSDGIVRLARILGAICRNTADLLVLWDLTEKIGQHRCIADMAPGNSDSPDFQRFLVVVGKTVHGTVF